MWKGTRDAFAAVVPAADSQITINLRYAGQYADAETGLYYNGFRYYDPLTGRYLQPDPLGLSGGLNSYTYALNNPLRYIDPEGQNPLALLPWIGYLAVGWVIGEAMDYLIGYLPDNECNPLLSLQRWANAASYAVAISSVQKGVKALTAAVKLRRGLGGRGAGNVESKLPSKPTSQASSGVVKPDKFTVEDLISSANKPMNSQGLSEAARAWEKHAGRQGGTFKTLKGNVTQKNAAANEFVKSVLENPNKIRTELSRGGFEYRLSSGKGIRYNSDGSFSTMLGLKR